MLINCFIGNGVSKVMNKRRFCASIIVEAKVFEKRDMIFSYDENLW